MIKKNKITAKVKGGYGMRSIEEKKSFFGKLRKTKKVKKSFYPLTIC
ncbi:MAG: hypothetical protein RLN62_07205 [Rickettsiales bacterium]